MKPIVIDAMKIVKENVTLNVEVRVINMRWVRIRLWIALQLCKVACWIGGMGLKVNQEVGVIVTNMNMIEKR